MTEKTDISLFSYFEPVDRYEELVIKDSNKISKVLKKTLPSELLLYFNGSQLQKNFRNLFNGQEHKIYFNDPYQNKRLPYVVYSLMLVAIILFSFAIGSFFTDSSLIGSLGLK
jgi:hypothetical protein